MTAQALETLANTVSASMLLRLNAGDDTHIKCNWYDKPNGLQCCSGSTPEMTSRHPTSERATTPLQCCSGSTPEMTPSKLNGGQRESRCFNAAPAQRRR